eukprot:TRINITY_DN371_c0_g1_i1.p1 TRINITY_DN371_c0_g1~~TRINITY_DN371_c0_g1_i1.p1  ORF type:complete len:288 (+),score=57.19 TRINITY_DN371_c0_g1_i1:40-903(+)
MQQLLLVAALALLAHGQITNLSLGDRLLRDYTVYDALPINTTAAIASGWQLSDSTCDPNLGLAYTYSGAYASQDYPLTLYFTSAGQIAGMGINIYGAVKQNLIDKGFFQPIDTNIYFMSVSFRNTTEMCSTSRSVNALGDRLIVNADTISYQLPVLESDAANLNWTKGACFYSMGYHYFYDLQSAPEMSWEAANLLPIVLMYNKGIINAVFFASSTVQQGILSAHWWDSIALPDFLMCDNWCDSNCTWNDTNFWSTFHLYFRDYTQAVCPGGCSISCCDSSDAISSN